MDPGLLAFPSRASFYPPFLARKRRKRPECRRTRSPPHAGHSNRPPRPDVPMLEHPTTRTGTTATPPHVCHLPSARRCSRFDATPRRAGSSSSAKPLSRSRLLVRASPPHHVRNVTSPITMTTTPLLNGSKTHPTRSSRFQPHPGTGFTYGPPGRSRDRLRGFASPFLAYPWPQQHRATRTGSLQVRPEHQLNGFHDPGPVFHTTVSPAYATLTLQGATPTASLIRFVHRPKEGVQTN